LPPGFEDLKADIAAAKAPEKAPEQAPQKAETPRVVVATAPATDHAPRLSATTIAEQEAGRRALERRQ
jgi:hypothetical protein